MKLAEHTRAVAADLARRFAASDLVRKSGDDEKPISLLRRDIAWRKHRKEGRRIKYRLARVRAALKMIEAGQDPEFEAYKERLRRAIGPGKRTAESQVYRDRSCYQPNVEAARHRREARMLAMA